MPVNSNRWTNLNEEFNQSAEAFEATALEIYADSRSGTIGNRYKLAPGEGSEEAWREIFCRAQRCSQLIRDQINRKIACTSYEVRSRAWH